MGNGIEKYVSEHGSSAILNEFVSLISDKYKALEEKLVRAEARAEAAELEKKKLEHELYKLRDRVRELEERITGTHSTMEVIREDILQLLAKRPDLETEAVAAVLNINPEIAALHLRALEDQKFAYGSYDYAMSAPTTWFLLKDGRDYLIAQGLI